MTADFPNINLSGVQPDLQTLKAFDQLLYELLSERSLYKLMGKEEPLPALIFAQVPAEEQHEDLVMSQEQKLLEAAQVFLGADREILRITTPFAESLQVLPSSWEDVIMRIQGAGIVDAMGPVMEWLPSRRVEKDRESKLLRV